MADTQPISRPLPALVEQLRAVARCYSASCVFADVQGRAGVMHSGIKPIFHGKLVGTALTVRLSPGDLQDPLAALDIAQPGDVIVVDAGGETETSVWGGLMGALLGAGEVGLLGHEGPTWYRGYLQGDVPEACPAVQRALHSLGATRMVMGHTTQDDGRLAARCQGAVLGIDTGISAHYGAHAAALELRGDDAWALYPAGAEDLPDPP